VKYIFERTITETYEVEGVDAGHAQEKIENCDDLGQYLLYSHASEEFKIIGTKISEGNILPRKKG
jgi:hypothetical protein